MGRSPGTAILIPLLARQLWRQKVRRFRARGRTLSTLVLGFFAAYIGFTLFTLGAFFPVFAEQMAPGRNPQSLVDHHALSTLIGLFFLRFLLQKTPKMQVVPFLHLPVSRQLLVGLFSVTSIFSAHNLFPLVFAVPFAVRHLAPVHGSAGAAQWVAGVVALLLVSNFLNIYVRTQLNQRERAFLAGLALLLVLALADEYLGAGVLGAASMLFFGGMHTGSPLLTLSLTAWVTASALLAAGGLIEALRREDPEATRAGHSERLHELAERWDLAGHLVWLELRLMWRNRRPRHYLIVSLMFSTVYLTFLLASPGMFDGVVMGAVIGLFASGGFVLNYGQLMFAWDSSYLEGMLARSVRIAALTRAKTIVLQGSCLILFLVSLPVFLALRPELIPLHVAFLFYNAGVTSQVILELATRNRERVDLGRSGGFFNYEGFSVKHWIWFIPTALPPTILLFLLRDNPTVAWTTLAVTGLAGLAATELWTRRHARRVQRRKHTMLTGFSLRS